jgi:hypothetical protein
MFKVKDMTPREFIRYYGLMIHEADVLKFGLLLSCGDSPEQAFRLALNDDQLRLNAAILQLERLGYIKRMTDERQAKLDRGMVEHQPTADDETAPDLEVQVRQDEQSDG